MLWQNSTKTFVLEGNKSTRTTRLPLPSTPLSASFFALGIAPVTCAIEVGTLGVMFEIPSDLPLRLSALAWLLGRWQGWGTIAAPGTMPPPRGASQEPPSDNAEPPSDSAEPPSGEPGASTGAQPGTPEDEVTYLPVLQDITADIVGEQMRVTLRVFEGVLEDPFDPTWTAEEGLNQIAPGALVSEETTYWSVDTPLAVVPAGPDEPRELRVVGSGTRGFAIMWAGVAMGPRIQLASDVVARAPRADALDYFTRMFGLVGGELMWASESMPRGGDYEVELTGRLRRASSEEVQDENE